LGPSVVGKRRDAFGLALRELRARIRDGRARPGALLVVADLAAELKSSPTPVREALAWLAGEALVESRRGAEAGYRVRRISRSGVEELYALQAMFLDIAAQAAPQPHWPAGSARAEVYKALTRVAEPASSMVAATELLFGGAVSALRNRALWEMQLRLSDRLALVRRTEAQLFPGLSDELMSLALAFDAGAETWRRALSASGVRRATRLARVLEALDPPPSLTDIIGK
jgi:DNA-binding GntR family transcriptional regulator